MQNQKLEQMEVEEQDSDTQQQQQQTQKSDKNCVKRVANNLLNARDKNGISLFTSEEKNHFSQEVQGEKLKPIQTKKQWNNIQWDIKTKMNKYALVSLLADVHSTKIIEPFSIENLNSYNQLFGQQVEN